MCGILLHYSLPPILPNDIDYNSLDILQYLSEYLTRTTTAEAIVDENFQSNQTFQSLVPKILSRGSDFARYLKPNEHLEFFSSVLSLRSPFTEQPISNESFILQFNGELYNQEIDGNDHLNDTAFIFEKLNQTHNIIRVIGSLQGEFSYSIYDLKNEKIYFGRDNLGKKSLSYSITDEEFFISSCCPSGEIKNSFVECLNAKVYIFDVLEFLLEVVNYSDNEYLPCTNIVNDLLTVDNETEIIETLQDKLTLAVESRIKNVFPIHPAVSNFGILFSGGLDCTVLASIAGSISNPGTKIDLLNVSFYNPRTQMHPSQTPDRKLSIKSWYNLYKLFIAKGVEFQLIEVDVPYDEYINHKNRVIDLIYPNDTEMDLSIAIAFYFASRGIGRRVIFDELELNLEKLIRESYESRCKVLLSGLGADELFGGYTRHERVFTYISNNKKRQLQGLPPKNQAENDMKKLETLLRDELQQDLSNLHVRNLSRDDKVVSSWSKELRYPFLDTNVISFVTEKVPLMMKLKYDPATGQITRKYILRQLASLLGVEWVAQEAKRAIQFGAKSAKMESGSGKMKGTDKLTATAASAAVVVG